MKQYIQITSSGKSMFPLISSGDRLTVQLDYPFSQVQSGDIVLYRNYTGNLLSHRVTKVVNGDSGRLLKVKGDFNLTEDGDLVNGSSYIGIVTVIKNGAYVLDLEVFISKLIIPFFQIYSFLMSLTIPRKYIFKLVHNYFFYEVVILKILAQKRNRKGIDLSYDFLLSISKEKGKKCKWDFQQNVVLEDRLFKIAENNKSITYFNHILNCINCRSYFSDQFLLRIENLFKKNIFLDWQKDKLKNDLHLIAKKLGVRFVLLKKYQGDIKLKQNTTYDIDILVGKRYLKRYLIALYILGYRTKDCPPQEVQLIHDKHNLVIDLHYYSSIPRNLIFTRKETMRLTKDILSHSKDGIIEIEYYILSSVVRLWANDLFHGLRKIFELSKIISEDSNINWQKLQRISSHYGFWDEVQLLMFVGNNIFNLQLNENYISSFGVNKRAKLLSKHFDLKRIATYQGEGNWWDENSYFARKFLVELHVMRLALKLPLHRMIFKPRVVLLLLSCIKSQIFI